VTVTIGLGISVPFIIIAFNVDRIAGLLKFFQDSEGHLWRAGFGISAAVGGFAAILAPVWTSELSTGIKSGVSICVVVLTLAAAAGFGVYRLAHVARSHISIPSGSSSGSTRAIVN
jgi:hypothetical protein